MSDKIYPSMVIRSQAEAIELLEQENSQLKEDIKGLQCERQTLYNTIHDLQKANKKLYRKIEKIKHILNNQMDYREYVDILNAIEEILKGDKE